MTETMTEVGTETVMGGTPLTEQERETRDWVINDPPRGIAYVTIGNSDDHLTQREWAAFVEELQSIVEVWAKEVHGMWFSLPSSPWQNCCVCFELAPPASSDYLELLRSDLRGLAARYGQESIALAVVGAVEMVRP